MPHPDPKENQILLCLDFDGTLTNRPGAQLVFGEFYKSLQTNPHASYTRAIFKDNIQDTFEEKFNGPFSVGHTYTQDEADILISEGALAFLKEALKHDTVKINIITRNRQDYIGFVLAYQGFSEEDIAKITFYSRIDKSVAANTAATPYDSKMLQAIVCDDDFLDALAMKDGLKQRQISDDQIFLHNNEPGDFPWDTIRGQLVALLNPTDIQAPLDQMPRNLATPSPINPEAPLTQHTPNIADPIIISKDPINSSPNISTNRYSFYARVTLCVLTPPFAIFAGLFNPVLGIAIGTIAALMFGLILMREIQNTVNSPQPTPP